jgi:peroxiredoxin
MARLKAGDTFPDFQVHTASEADLSTQEIIGKAKKTVFWVLRDVGCTSCRYDIHLIKEQYQKFTKQGVQILVVLQSQPDIVRSDLKGDEVPYEIICDPDQTIYRRFSIEPAPNKETLRPTDPELVKKWEKKVEGLKASGFVHGKYEGDENQLPALFIVGSDAVVLEAHYAASIADMPTVDELLKKTA